MYRVMLQFEESGPGVTGEWASGATARKTYREWIGLYAAKDSAVVVQLVEETDGVRRTLRRWTAQGEVVAAGELAN
ncbi:hypothetical protein [Streptomyces sp. ME19-01-6]|uniref:hypothetical protein n=1 Tax=Streptomyces sp. ME19-01-6 TaxID=3028686 RepID=UPI0029B58E12|nr:hypothetical protein [Streptomyces sp. ME19-01-6]MDX3232560.1 hypothetical protein [Streptomyces sp. ME19-01-6]